MSQTITTITITTNSSDNVSVVKETVANKETKPKAAKPKKNRSSNHIVVEDENIVKLLCDVGLLRYLHGVTGDENGRRYFFDKNETVMKIIKNDNNDDSSDESIETMCEVADNDMDDDQ